jgi:hypothetical protein
MAEPLSPNGPATGVAGSAQPASAPSSPASSPSSASPQQGGGSAPSGFTMPKELVGKSAEDLGRMYTELQSQHGRHTEELGSLRKFKDEASRFINDWDPMLRQVAYRPDLLAQVLESRAQQQYRQGDPQGARETQQVAQQARRWADAVMPNEQEEWIGNHVNQSLASYAQRLEQALQTRLGGLENYMTRFGEYALRAMDARAGNPNLTIDQILQGAVRAAQQPQDPINAAVQHLTAPAQFQTWVDAHDADLKRQWEEQQKNQQSTMFVGAGIPSRPLRPSAPPSFGGMNGSQQAQSPNLPPAGFSRTQLQNQQMADAKQRAISKIGSFLTGQQG